MDRCYRVGSFIEVEAALSARSPTAVRSISTLRDLGFDELTGVWVRTSLRFPPAVVQRIEQDAPGRVAAMEAPVPTCWLVSADRLTLARVQDGVELWSICDNGAMACTTSIPLDEQSQRDLAAVGQHVQVAGTLGEAVVVHPAWAAAIASMEAVLVPFQGVEDLLLAARLHWWCFHRALRRREVGGAAREALARRVDLTTLRAMPVLPAGPGEVGGWRAPD